MAALLAVPASERRDRPGNPAGKRAAPAAVLTELVAVAMPLPPSRDQSLLLTAASPGP